MKPNRKTSFGCVLPWLLFSLCACLCGAGCATQWPNVMDPNDVETLSEGAPRISRIADLGSPHIGKPGPLLPSSDGHVLVGEQLLIQGSGFGKQPTVLIGQRPAEVRWRTVDGGIVVQIPRGLSAGVHPLVVESAGKRAERPVTLLRLAVVLDGTRGILLALRVSGGNGQPPAIEAFGQPVPMQGAAGLAMSPDGAAAYVHVRGKDRDEVAVVDLTAPHGPALRDTRQPRHRVEHLVASTSAPVLALLGENDVTVWDLGEANRPTPWPKTALPAEAAGAAMWAIHPTGTLLAAGFPERNEIALFDLTKTKTAIVSREVARATVFPLAKTPVLSAFRFSADGDALWVLAGDHRDGKKEMATQLVAVAVSQPDEAGKRTLALGKPIENKDMGSPVSLAVGRGRPVVSGASIRNVPERSFVVFATGPQGEGDQTTKAALHRLSGDGELKTIAEHNEPTVGLDLDPDAGLAVAVLHTKGGPLSVSALDTGHKNAATFVIGQPLASRTSGASEPSEKKRAAVELVVQP